MHLLIFLAEPLAFEFVLDLVARRGDFLPTSEDPLQSLFVAILDSLEESIAGFSRGRKGCRPRLLGETQLRAAHDQQRRNRQRSYPVERWSGRCFRN